MKKRFFIVFLDASNSSVSFSFLSLCSWKMDSQVRAPHTVSDKAQERIMNVFTKQQWQVTDKMRVFNLPYSICMCENVSWYSVCAQFSCFYASVRKSALWHKSWSWELHLQDQLTSQLTHLWVLALCGLAFKSMNFEETENLPDTMGWG